MRKCRMRAGWVDLACGPIRFLSLAMDPFEIGPMHPAVCSVTLPGAGHLQRRTGSPLVSLVLVKATPAF